MAGYGVIGDLRAEVDVPRDGILSRTVHEDDAISLTLFGFDAGQELTEHTSSRAALIEILEGEAVVTLDGDAHAARAGAWFAMPPGMRHALRATTPMKMALVLVKATGG